MLASPVGVAVPSKIRFNMDSVVELRDLRKAGATIEVLAAGGFEIV